MTSKFSCCLFCLGRLRSGVKTCRDCQSSLWRLEHLVSGSRDQAQNPLHRILQEENIAQPALRRSSLSVSQLEINEKNNCTSPFFASEEACVAMKRKMGQLWTSPSKPPKDKSPTVSPNEKEKKKARTIGQTGSSTTTQGASADQSDVRTCDSDSRGSENCLGKGDPVELEAEKTKNMTDPLVHTKDKLSSHVHQIFTQIAQKNPSPFTMPHIVPTTTTSIQHPLVTDSAVLSVASKSSQGHLEWLGGLPASMLEAQLLSMAPAKSQKSSASAKLSAAVSLMPCRSYSSSVTATFPQVEKSSLKEETERNIKGKGDVTDKDCPKANLAVEIVTLDRSSDEDQQDCALLRKHKQEASSTSKSKSKTGDTNTNRSRKNILKDVTSVKSKQKQKANANVEIVSSGTGSSSNAQKWGHSYDYEYEDDSHASTAESRQSDFDFEMEPETNSMFPEDFDDVRRYSETLWQLPREWEWTRYSAVRHSRAGNHHYNYRRGCEEPVEFSVMTYNVLAQNLLEDHPHLYTGCNPRWLDWGHRRRLLMAEIAYHDADIVNLQEVNKNHYFEYLKPRFERLGYTGRYQKRRGDKQDGCATLWKRDKFRLLRFTPVDYFRGGLLDRDNIAIIVELQPVRPGKHRSHGSGQDSSSSGQRGGRDEDDKLVVANTHLLFNPRRGDIKLAQLVLLLAEVDKHAYLGGPQHPHHDSRRQPGHSAPPSTSDSQASQREGSEGGGGYCPIIITGDFNMEPQSDLYKFVVSGQMDYEGLLVREMSGQEEGRYGRGTQLLERNFLSQGYGVTPSCQYHSIVTGREDGGSPSNDPSDESSSFSSSSSSSNKSSAVLSQSAGRLWHHLNLVSAYRHKVERLGRGRAPGPPEVTTHHDKGQCTVDYVFYSVASKDVRWHQRQHQGAGQEELRLGSVRDGRLKLLGRYGLMSGRELDSVGCIPNHVLPSDHVCLITRFLLT